MFSVSKKGEKFSRSSSRHGCKLIVSSFLSLSKRKKKEMVADAWRPDSAGFLCCKFVCGFHLLERLLKVHANWLFVAANSSFFDERAFWIRCNFVFHEILLSLSLFFWQSFKEICDSVEYSLLRSKFFARIVEIYRRTTNRAEIKSPSPDISSRSKFSLSRAQWSAWIFEPRKRLWLSIRLKHVSDLKDWRKWQVNRDRELSVVLQRFGIPIVDFSLSFLNIYIRE